MGAALSDVQAAAMTAVCQAAALELEERLRTGVTSEELGELFVTATGILAISMYVGLYGADQDFSQFSAGNIRVSKNSGGQSAAKLRKMAEEMLSGYLEDRGFSFLGVRG